MAKGFKDSSGNFHPTGNNGRKSSKEKSIETSGIPNLKGEPEQKSQATIDAMLLSDHFGTSDITAKGDRKYVIQFGEQGYNRLDNEVFDSFINEYPNGRMDIIPKDKKINIKFLDSEEQILTEELKQKIMGLGEERVQSTIHGTGEGSTPEQDIANTRAIWEREKKAVIELADLEFRTLREGFAES